MRRAVVLGAIVVLAGLTTAVGSAQQPQPTTPIQVETLAPNLYLLRGGGPIVRVGDVTLPASGTTLAFVRDEGVLLVDTKLPRLGADIVAAVRSVTDKPITAIINTHTHEDHVGSNPEFPGKVEVVAHETTARLMRSMHPVTGGTTASTVFADSNGRGLPTRTFADRLILGTGSDRVELRYFGPAHTGGDAWVVFPTQGVVHTGDVFAFKTFPIVDTNNGGSSVQYANTVARAAAALTGVRTVVTGHYPRTLTPRDLVVYGEFVRDFVEAVREAKNAGRAINDFAKAWRVPERFLHEGYLDTRPYPDVVWSEVQ